MINMNMGVFNKHSEYAYLRNGELPPQALSTKKKNEEWAKSTMDALESIGIKQIKENLKFKDFYRMVEGKLSFTELSEVMPQLREVENSLDSIDIPTFLKHYDLIGIIVNAMVGEFMNNSDKYNVTNIDEISDNEYERKKQDLFKKHLQEELQKELNQRLIEMGINPDPSSLDLKNEEQVQQYLQQIQQLKNEMSPREIEKYMNTSWKTVASIWGEHTLEADRQRFHLDEMDREELVDYLLTGRCFRNFRVGYDYYKPERWSPLNTFFSQDIETKYVQDGEYVGRVHFYTPSQIINKYGHLLSKKQKDNLLGGSYLSYGSNEGNGVIGKYGQTQILPNKQYHDYNFALDIQNEFGVPLGEKTTIDSEGNTVTTDAFLPNRFNGFSNNNNIARLLRDDIEVRSDLIQTTEAYWLSYRKIGYLTYETEEGRIEQEIVTEDILSEFLKEYKIKNINTKSLDEIEKNPEPNTIVWDYIPEVWKGVKLSGSYLSDPIYLEVEALPYQIKGDSNIYDVKLPVAGYIGTSLALKLQPFQIAHNVAMNQAYNLMEKEIGLFFIFDINFLPSEFKEWGDSEETLIHLRNIVKEVGFFPVDTSIQNTRNGGGFNQFSVQNLSFGPYIAEKLNVADTYKQRAFEQVGFNPQRLGAPVKYETAEGVRNSQNASYAQTEIYFDKFSEYKTRMLEMHLNIAQYAQKEGKDVTVSYTKSDASRAYLKFTDPYFPLRNFGIMPLSNAKKRRELESFKSYLLQTNTLGSDEAALASLFSSDTMVELIDAARQERLRRDKAEEMNHQRQMEAIERQAQVEEEKELAKWKREEYSKEKDREVKINTERIEALGRAADNNADSKQLDFINKNADLALQQSKQQAEIELSKEKLEMQKDKNDKEYQLKMQKLKNEVRALDVRINENKTKRYIAEINKN